MAETSKRLKIAMLVSDEREVLRRYGDLEPGFGPAPDALLSGLAQLPECEVHTICCVQKPLHSPEKVFGTIQHHTLLVPKIGWLKTLYAGCIRAIRKELEQIKPDLVHGQGTERHCALVAALSGYPNLITIHGNMRQLARINRPRPFSFYWLTARLEGFTLPRAGGVICISSHTQEEVTGLAQRTWKVLNAIHPSFFTVNRSVQSKPQLLCVGDILHHKNQNRLIQALDPLTKEAGFKLLFLGKADERDPYVRDFFGLVASRGWCEYGGYAERPKLQGFLSQATLLVLPSLEENCPLVVLEAMAAGVPVVVARVGGVPDLVQDGVNGLLFEPKEADSIREAIRKFVVMPDLREQMARRGQEWAVSHVHPVQIAQSHLQIYREAIELQRKFSSHCR